MIFKLNKIGVPSIDIYGQAIDARIDIKNPKIDISWIGWDIYGSKRNGIGLPVAGIHGPQIGVPSFDIHVPKIDNGIDIKKSRIDIPGFGLDIHRPSIGDEIGLPDVDIHEPKIDCWLRYSLTKDWCSIICHTWTKIWC